MECHLVSGPPGDGGGGTAHSGGTLHRDRGGTWKRQNSCRPSESYILRSKWDQGSCVQRPPPLGSPSVKARQSCLTSGLRFRLLAYRACSTAHVVQAYPCPAQSPMLLLLSLAWPVLCSELSANLFYAGGRGCFLPAWAVRVIIVPPACESNTLVRATVGVGSIKFGTLVLFWQGQGEDTVCVISWSLELWTSLGWLGVCHAVMQCFEPWMLFGNDV